MTALNDLTAVVQRNSRYVSAIIQHMADSCPHCQGSGRLYESVMDLAEDPAEKPCEVCAGLRQIIKEQL